MKDEERLTSLSPRTISSVEALAEALFLTADGPPPVERVRWLSREVDDFFARSGSKSRLVFVLSLFAVGLLAPLHVRSAKSLRAMPVALRGEAIGRLERGIFALPLLALKAILCIIYYEHPDASLEIGFDGTCLGSPR